MDLHISRFSGSRSENASYQRLRAQENIFQGLLRERAGRTQEEPELAKQFWYQTLDDIHRFSSLGLLLNQVSQRCDETVLCFFGCLKTWFHQIFTLRTSIPCTPTSSPRPLAVRRDVQQPLAPVAEGRWWAHHGRFLQIRWQGWGLEMGCAWGWGNGWLGWLGWKQII